MRRGGEEGAEGKCDSEEGSEEGAEGKCDSEEGTMYRAPTGEAGTLLRR